MSDIRNTRPKISVTICSSCLVKNISNISEQGLGPQRFNPFKKDILIKLESLRPEISWSVDTQSCFRFCPENKITLSVDRKITMTRKANVDSTVQEILSQFDNLKK